MYCKYEKAAQMIYKELQGEGIYHLSQVCIQKHRKRVFKENKRTIKK